MDVIEGFPLLILLAMPVSSDPQLRKNKWTGGRFLMIQLRLSQLLPDVLTVLQNNSDLVIIPLEVDTVTDTEESNLLEESQQDLDIKTSKAKEALIVGIIHGRLQLSKSLKYKKAFRPPHMSFKTLEDQKGYLEVPKLLGSNRKAVSYVLVAKSDSLCFGVKCSLVQKEINEKHSGPSNQISAAKSRKQVDLQLGKQRQRQGTTPETQGDETIQLTRRIEADTQRWTTSRQRTVQSIPLGEHRQPDVRHS
nr:unnamed protein product [Callosobruchus analis]